LLYCTPSQKCFEEARQPSPKVGFSVRSKSILTPKTQHVQKDGPTLGVIPRKKKRF
jgi:hypothetical protein